MSPVTSVLDEVVADLEAENEALDAIVSAAPPSAFDHDTPAAGWTVADCIGHLWFFDGEAVSALTTPDQFRAGLEAVAADPPGYLAGHLEASRGLMPSELLDAWRARRHDVVRALHAVDPTASIPWYGPPMSPASFATARLMECWAHGQDICDALAAPRPVTMRLRHIARLGVRTRGFSFAVRGLPVPEAPVRVELSGPDGADWSDGPVDADDHVTGPLLDFCLLVTQRRPLSSLRLAATGGTATAWLAIAQAFAGEPSQVDPARAALPLPI